MIVLNCLHVARACDSSPWHDPPMTSTFLPGWYPAWVSARMRADGEVVLRRVDEVEALRPGSAAIIWLVRVNAS